MTGNYGYGARNWTSSYAENRLIEHNVFNDTHSNKFIWCPVTSQYMYVCNVQCTPHCVHTHPHTRKMVDVCDKTKSYFCQMSFSNLVIHSNGLLESGETFSIEN